MVLTITLVNNNGGQQAPAPSDSQEMQWSPNDLAQLMSGQTLTGLLNPDGTITLNSHLIPAQHQHHQHHHQLDSVHSHLNTGMQPLNSSMQSPGPPLNTPTTTVGPSAPSFQYCRSVKLETNLPNSNSLSNMHAISTGDLSNMNIINSNNNNNNNDLNSSALISNNSQPPQAQSGSQVQMQNKKTGQKRLTAKQKQALQQQQQQQQQQPQQTQLVEPMQSPDTRQSQQMNSLNSDQVGLRPQQPQVVATVQLPNGQIGQLIAPSGGFWSPNALDLQQLSMAVAAATGAMPQSLSLPMNSGQSAMQISGSNQQQLQMANDHQTQMQHHSVITTSQGLDSSMIQNSGPTISTSRSNISNSNQRGNQLQFNNGNFQIAQRQNQLQQTSIQASIPQQQSSSHQTNQGLISVSPHNESDSGPMSNQQGKKLKRLACTCPNCRDGDNSRSGGGDKKKQHICHFPDCNKVYGKTSHLRAHLRWHSGERPYICSWAFCGKKFTRSDELQRHRRTHTGEKRFQCQECNKRFMRSDHLSKHLKIHLSSKKCGSTSQQSPLLDSTQTF